MSLNQRGAALITTLIMIVVVGGIALLMFNRSVSEMNHSRDNVAITQTMMLARGGANAGGAILANLRDEIQDLVEDKGSSSNPWVFGGSGKTPDPEEVAEVLKKVVADSLQTEVDGSLCKQNFKPEGSSATVSVRVYFTSTACGVSLPASTRLPDGRFVSGKPRSQQSNNDADLQTYSLPFVMVAEAVQGNYKRNIVLQGEYQFNVGRSSFARYAYFANDRRVNGNFVYFTTEEMIDGPVHSNEYLRFSGKPWFGSEVTVASCTNPGTTDCSGSVKPGDYFNGANFVAENSIDTFCKSNDCPTFGDKKSFSAAFIPLPSESTKQRDMAKSSGLLFANTLSDLKLYTMEESGETYQVIRVETCANTPDTSNANDLTCTTPTTVREFRFGDTKVAGQGYPLEENINGTWKAYKNNDGLPYYFKGVLYTDGGIANLGGPDRSNASDPKSADPAIADFAQMTIAGTGRMIINRDIKYSDPPCSNTAQWNDGDVIKADCDNLDAENVLGIYSLKGDVLFGTGTASTLTELTVHATVMSSGGRVGVNNWNTVTNTKSNLNILGGLIGKSVAGFASSGGYKRNITYDKRLGEGLAPPHFPTTGGDQVKAVFLFSYGQREQVY